MKKANCTHSLIGVHLVSNWGSDIWDDGLEELEVEASPVLAELQLLSYGGDVLLSHKFEIDTRDIPAIKRL